MQAAISFNQIRAEVSALQRKRAVERPVGIRTMGRWLGDPVTSVGDTHYQIHQCDSPLALRLALREPPPDGTGRAVKVLLTSLSDQDISADIFARLHRHRLFAIDRWSLVQQQFAAETIDPRLAEFDWLADAAIEYLAGRRPAAAKSGCLGLETLWRELLAATIGLNVDVPDLASLFRWSLDADNVRRYCSLTEPLRGGLRAWLGERAGTAADFVFSVIEKTQRPDAVPLGLAVGVVVSDEAGGQADRPLGKLEATFLDSDQWPDEVLRRVAGEAAALVRSGMADPVEKRQVFRRAEELVQEVGAAEWAGSSSVLPLGLTRRLGVFARAVSDFTAGGATSLGPLLQAAERVRNHDETHARKDEQERLEMALRLARWLHAEKSSATPPASLADAASVYCAEGAFVDWARDSISRAAESRELADAVTALWTAVTERQEIRAREFAGLLQDATASGTLPGDLLGVEQLLDELVVPLAQQRPVLLIVLDGMSAAVCRELTAKIVGENKWRPIVETGRTDQRPVLATIPSETVYSRASLFAGKLATRQLNEAAAFAAHQGLLATSATARPPLLFKKAALANNSVPDEVRDEIADSKRRVVGVVINAIDDHLGKADQLTVRWSTETVGLLTSLLFEAKAGGRVVMLTSDHGHVLDRGTTARVTDGGSARWRPAGGKPLEPDELVMQGSRVLVPGGQLIASWSERVRYIATANRGYHGGINPQEMLIPVTVLIPTDTETEPEGWQPAVEATPVWWDDEAGLQPQERAAAEPAPPQPVPAGMLFDKNREDSKPAVARPPAAASESTAAPGWLAEVFATEVFAAQRRLLSRAYPGDELFSRLVQQLDAHGGRMTKTALTRSLSYPPFRLSGLLSQGQRLFNVDGYQVLAVDTESDTVIFDRQLLLVQFGVAAGEDTPR